MKRTVSEGIPVSTQTKFMLQLMYNITLRDQTVAPRGVTGVYTALFLFKHRFYVQIPILFGGQNSEGYAALTMWTIIAQAEPNRYRSNLPKLFLQGMREDAGAYLRRIFQIFLKMRNLLLYC